MNLFLGWIIHALGIISFAVRRVMPMQHAEILLSFAVIVPTAFLAAFLLSGCLIRLVIRDWVHPMQIPSACRSLESSVRFWL